MGHAAVLVVKSYVILGDPSGLVFSVYLSGPAGVVTAK